MTDKRTELSECKHAWKNVSSKRQTVYQCDRCGIYTFEQPAQQQDIDWKDQYEKQKRRAEMWVAKYEADINPLEKAGPVTAQQQEPYAWMAVGGTIWRHKTTQDDVPLYLSPPPRKPLTDEECDAVMLALDEWARDVDHYEYGLPIYSQEHREKAREVIRAALGITGETK